MKTIVHLTWATERPEDQLAKAVSKARRYRIVLDGNAAIEEPLVEVYEEDAAGDPTWNPLCDESAGQAFLWCLIFHTMSALSAGGWVTESNGDRRTIDLGRFVNGKRATAEVA